MTYRAPLADMDFALKYGAALLPALEEGFFGDLTMDDVDAVLAEAGRFAAEVIAPLNRVGDQARRQLQGRRRHHRARLEGGLHAWRQGGWNGLASPTEWGGQGLPQVRQRRLHRDVERGVDGFRRRPDAHHGARSTRSTPTAATTLKRTYLEKLISGEWTGTMQLTEPQAGSDVGALRTRAERAGDGSYRITGQKIFITYGEHDLTDNIIHFVLARLPDAPPGTRGISLFLVPKFLLNADGSLGARNDVRAHSIEHKLGIHGSPTCTMIFGDQGGATGYLDRRRECRHGLHVHHDEPRAARGRPARRRHRRTRHAAGARLCARAQARPHRRHAGDANRRRSSRIPTSSACC